MTDYGLISLEAVEDELIAGFPHRIDDEVYDVLRALVDELRTRRVTDEESQEKIAQLTKRAEKAEKEIPHLENNLNLARVQATFYQNLSEELRVERDAFQQLYEPDPGASVSGVTGLIQRANRYQRVIDLVTHVTENSELYRPDVETHGEDAWENIECINRALVRRALRQEN
jgi:pantoate kinase